MKAIVYTASSGKQEVLGVVTLESGVAVFDEGADRLFNDPEFPKRVFRPGTLDPIDPQDGEAYISALSANFQRDTYLYAEIVD